MFFLSYSPVLQASSVISGLDKDGIRAVQCEAYDFVCERMKVNMALSVTLRNLLIRGLNTSVVEVAL